MGMDRKFLHGIECQAALLCHGLQKKNLVCSGTHFQWNSIRSGFHLGLDVFWLNPRLVHDRNK